jgi:hypothetical protein
MGPITFSISADFAVNYLISFHSLFSVTTTRKENSVFSTTCFDLLKSLSSAVCHTINMSLIVYNCGKPLLCYHVLLLAIDNKNPWVFYCEYN